MSDADNEMHWLEVVEESKGKLAEDPKNTTLPFKLGCVAMGKYGLDGGGGSGIIML